MSDAQQSPQHGSVPPVSVWLLFLSIVASAFYLGPAHNLHVFSLTAALLAAWLVAAVRWSGWTGFQPISLLAIAYLAWLLISPAWSIYPHISWLHALTLAALPVSFLAWPLQGDSDASWRKLWRALVVAGAFLAVWAAVDYVYFHERAHGPFNDPNAFGALLNMLLLPLTYQYFRGETPRGFSPKVVLGIALLLIAALFMSQSRGALLALALTLPLAAWAARGIAGARPRIIRFLALAAFAYLAVGWSPAIRSPEPQSGIPSQPAAYIQADASVRERLLLWEGTWKIFVNEGAPIIGTGLGTFKTLYAAYRSPMDTSAGNFAHNDYLQALQEGGVVLFIFLLLFTVAVPVWLFGRAMARNPSCRDSCGLLLGIAAISLHASVNFIHNVPALILLTGLFLARSWEVAFPAKTSGLLPGKPARAALRAMGIALLLLATVSLVIDGLIFKIYSDSRPWISRLDSTMQFRLSNVLSAVRSSNLAPREWLIWYFVRRAESALTREERLYYCEHAMKEAERFAEYGPGMPFSQFYLARVHIASGDPNRLAPAQALLEEALRRLPTASVIRLELTKLYVRRGEEGKAYEVSKGVKQWASIETDLGSFASLAREVHQLAGRRGDTEEMKRWARVLEELDHPPSAASSLGPRMTKPSGL
ncbi:O-antigen polymerase [Sulfurifustis variabilis]|uniref:O-antigen polymerase n=1 Tax=Sulfurifustis variabilis TaxID=1675686 RepID=A0A1B4V566_9GAMM|nr:O-antigen polymerase [Sulfurifustis variabilis]